MLEGLIVIYVSLALVMVFQFIPLVNEIMFDLEDFELKIKHVAMAMLFFPSLVFLLAIIVVFYLGATVIDFFRDLTFLNRTIWKKK